MPITWNGDEDSWPNMVIQESRQSVCEINHSIRRLESASRQNRRNNNANYILLEDDAITSALSNLGKLLIVRSCGYVEVTVEQSILANASKGDSSIFEYVKNTLGKGRRTDKGRIKEVFKHFGINWEHFTNNNIKSYLTDIGAMYDYRNRISHGESENLTFNRAIELSNSAICMGDILYTSLAPKGNK